LWEGQKKQSVGKRGCLEVARGGEQKIEVVGGAKKWRVGKNGCPEGERGKE